MTTAHKYRLNRATNVGVSLARAWLLLAIAALACAGVLAILIGSARTPGLQDKFTPDFFSTMEIIHVNLSVLVWFLAFAGVIWSVAGTQRAAALGWAALAATATGMALLLASPFQPDAYPSLNDYIPVLQQPLFFYGLGSIALGAVLLVARALFTLRIGKFWLDAGETLRFGMLLAAVAGAVALGAFATSWLTQPLYTGSALYQAVFWGGGHALQFQHTLLLLVVWFWLASDIGHAPRVPPAVAAALFALAALPVLAVPIIYWAYPVGDWQSTAAFGNLMRYGHLAMLPALAVVAYSLATGDKQSSPIKAALLASFVLFGAGGVLAYVINGANVTVPAHYHGAIVGITLAFMGLTYLLLPRLGWAEPAPRLARWQPYLYGCGQLLHMIGLAWSGGYGVLRKVGGTGQVLTTSSEKMAMGLMGLGMMIAVLGGLLFVVICLQSMLRKPTKKPPTSA